MSSDFKLNPDTSRQPDRELREKFGVEISHPPFLSDRFEPLFMETQTEA